MLAGHVGAALAIGRVERRVNTDAFIVAALELPLILLLALGLCGCHAMTRQVASTLQEAELGLAIDYERVRADGGWSTGEPGHGLWVDVWADRNAADYKRSLERELEDAAKVFAALARNDRLLEWAYLNVKMCNRYSLASNASRKSVGVAEVSMRREALAALRESNAPASEYPRHWRFLRGYKDQPDSEKVLAWEGVQSTGID